jgi:hypothetical protein
MTVVSGPCTETYCLGHDEDDGCIWPEHAVWCDGACTKTQYGECDKVFKGGNPRQGSGFFELGASCAMDAATCVTGEINVYTSVQLDEVIAALIEMREWVIQEEELRARQAANA